MENWNKSAIVVTFFCSLHCEILEITTELWMVISHICLFLLTELLILLKKKKKPCYVILQRLELCCFVEVFSPPLSFSHQENAMAPHSSTLAWKIPWTEEPGRLQPMGSLRVRHDWATSISLSTFTHWRKKLQPTPVFLLGESQGQGCLVGSYRVRHDWSDLAAIAAAAFLRLFQPCSCSTHSSSVQLIEKNK